jgi:GABA permease
VSWTTKLLVIANRTADSDELCDALRARAIAGPVEVTLVAPASAPRTARRVERAVKRLSDAGVPVVGIIDDPDPMVAVQSTWNPRSYDEVIVATLPTDVSHWQRLDLPNRIRSLTDARVTHVVATDRQPAARSSVAGSARS